MNQSIGPTPLSRLLQAKAESDRRNYAKKHLILQQMLAAAPQDFVQDSTGAMPGITHIPTGFRIHLPPHLARKATGALLPAKEAFFALGRELQKAALAKQPQTRKLHAGSSPTRLREALNAPPHYRLNPWQYGRKLQRKKPAEPEQVGPVPVETAEPPVA